MDFFQNFGVQPILLIAQIINFLILLFILKKVFYKPMLNYLEKRRRKIEKGVELAEKADAILAKAEEKYEKKIGKAKQDVELLLEDSRHLAQKMLSDAQEKARQDTETTIAEMNEKIKLQKQKMKEEAKEEIAQIVSYALEKVAGKLIGGDKKKQDQYLDQTLKEIDEQKAN